MTNPFGDTVRWQPFSEGADPPIQVQLAPPPDPEKTLRNILGVEQLANPATREQQRVAQLRLQAKYGLSDIEAGQLIGRAVLQRSQNRSKRLQAQRMQAVQRMQATDFVMLSPSPIAEWKQLEEVRTKAKTAEPVQLLPDSRPGQRAIILPP